MRQQKSFLLEQMALLVNQLKKYEKWNERTTSRLRSTEYITAIGGNEADCAHIFADTEVDCISVECSRQIILKIHDALSLISADLKNSGNHYYGLCSDGCGSPIDTQRLMAVPWADLCVQCQEKIEETSGKSYTSPGAGVNSGSGVHKSRTIATRATGKMPS